MCKSECHLHPLACGFPQIMFIWYLWCDLTGKLKIICCMKYTKGIANWNMTLAFIHGKSTYKLPFSSIIDSSWLQPQTILCYWLPTKRQFIFQNNFLLDAKKDIFLTVGCILCYFDLNCWSDTGLFIANLQEVACINMLRFVQCFFFHLHQDCWLILDFSKMYC